MSNDKQHVFRVTLTVKGDDRRKADEELIKRMNAWLLEDCYDGDPHFPEGSLLHYVIHAED